MTNARKLFIGTVAAASVLMPAFVAPATASADSGSSVRHFSPEPQSANKPRVVGAKIDPVDTRDFSPVSEDASSPRDVGAESEIIGGNSD